MARMHHDVVTLFSSGVQRQMDGDARCAKLPDRSHDVSRIRKMNPLELTKHPVDNLFAWLSRTGVGTGGALALGVVITCLSLMPARDLPDASLLVWDKAQHALAWFGVGVLGVCGYPNRHLVVLLIAWIWSVAIEVLQHASGERMGDWQDALANGIGLALALAVTHRWRKLRGTTA